MAGSSAETIQQLADAILAENRSHRAFLNSSISGMTCDIRQELVDYIEYCSSRGLSIDYLADCYNTITQDTLLEQVYFQRNRKYRYSSFKDVADHVYFDSQYMKKYMHGLALTALLWSNHVAMYNFFTESFPQGQRGKYLEIGPGHGYYFRRAAELGHFDRMIGIDISPASVEMCKDILERYQIQTAVEIKIHEADFLRYSHDDTEFSCIVMGEVLEHVEKPGLFLDKIAELSTPATHIYLTTCINAAAVDHIFLFRNLEEVEALIRASGLIVKQRCVAPYVGKSLGECESEGLPVNVAYVAEKRACP